MRGSCSGPVPAAPRRAARNAQQRRVAARAAKKDEPDLIERAVGWLFPKALSDPAPMGMKRIDFESLPDQRVEMERAAALLPGAVSNWTRVQHPKQLHVL